MNDLFGYIESKTHEAPHDEDGMMYEAKKKKMVYGQTLKPDEKSGNIN